MPPWLSMIPRIAGVSCLVGVGLVGAFWWNIANIMNPLSEEVVLSTELTSLAFIPTQEVSERKYDVTLYFKDRPEFSSTCEDIQSLGVQWLISTSEIVKSWNSLEHDEFSCESREFMTSVSFPAPSFKASTKYYVHLSIDSKSQNRQQTQTHVVIHHTDGIAAHYLFMDMALLELLGGALFFISLFCLSIDAWRFFRSWVLSQKSTPR